MPDEQTVKDQVSKVQNDSRLEKVKNIADSLLTIKERIDAIGLKGELVNVTTVYSKRMLRKLYDSLGVARAEKLLKIGTELATSDDPKRDLIEQLNAPLDKTPGLRGLGFDQEKGVEIIARPKPRI